MKLSRSWRIQVEEESMEVGLIKEDALWRLSSQYEEAYSKKIAS